ncbi:MAG TPA: M14 family zinc carboxypeptidase [Gemmatimonadaceae bacterium]|nr:M14 family zinc carboxypeptidase [Gemmatimonadaceae bacterium]
MLRRALLLLALPSLAVAQHPFSSAGETYDAAVPAPSAILGYRIGERFTPHHMMLRYVDAVGATSRRVHVDTTGYSVEGRPLLLIAVSSERNIGRLSEIRADAQRLADPRTVATADWNAAVSRLPAIVWLEHSVHGGEASGFESAIALLYQLAAGTDAATRDALENVVVLIDPSENPDGHERHVHDVQRASGIGPTPVTPGAMIHRGSWPGPRYSHYGFDLNRDWFILSHPESRARTAAFMRWWPHVAVDLHEMGTNSTYYFAPPMEPNNHNNPKHLAGWFERFGSAHASAFDAHGWSYFRREGYDSFYPGYGEAWPMLTGAIGMLFEAAASSGGAIRREDGTVRTLHDAIWQQYTAERATVLYSAANVRELVRDYADFRRAPARDDDGPRGMLFARDGDGRADSLAALLLDNGIEVARLRSDASVVGTAYGASASASVRMNAGAYAVNYDQPQGRLARAILEPDAKLDTAFIRTELESRRTGLPDRFYDVTAWSLPLAFRLDAWETRALPRSLEPVTRASLQTAVTEPTRASYAYAFEPGSEASLRLLGSLLADSVRIWYAQRAFALGGASFPKGAFIVRVEANHSSVHARVRDGAVAAGAHVTPLMSAAVDSGADLGSNSVMFVRPPHVALLGGPPVGSSSFGFAWYAIDQRLRYPVATVDIGFIAGAGLDEFNVLIVPSASAGALDRELGDDGRANVARWVRNGGVLITLENATAWLATEQLGLARIRMHRDSTRADSAGGARLNERVPGAIVRVTADTLSPLMAGIRDTGFPVFLNSDRVVTLPDDLEAGEAVVRFAAADRLRLSGYLWPEADDQRALSPWVWTERVGSGRVIGFVEDPLFRDLFRGLLPIFANAVLLGPSW